MDNDIDNRAGGGTCVLAPGLSSLSDDELTVGHDQAIAASRQAEWDVLAVEAEIDRRRMYLDDGTASLREWISIRTGEGDRAAYHHARVARHLGRYPALSAALSDGRVSVAHIRELLTLARLTDTDDHRLVELGETHTVPQLETLRRSARPVTPTNDDNGHRRRHLRWRYDDHGTVRLNGQLHGPEALTVTNLIAAMAETTDDTPTAETPAPFDTRCADALIDLCTQQINANTARRAEIVIHVPLHTLDTLTHPNPTSDGDSDDAGADDSPADDSTADDAGADDRDDSHPCSTDAPDSHQADPVDDNPADNRFDEFDLVGPDPYGLDRPPVDHPTGTAMTWDGTPLSSAALQRLLCDCNLRVTIDDTQGHALGIGFRSRNIPHWLRAQLRWRDGSCRFPGCERTRWVHGHHLTHWPHGPTNLDNLTLLCSSHHRLVHEGGWHVTGDPDHQLTFTSPTGHTHTTQPAPHPKPPPPPPKRRRRPRRSPDSPLPTSSPTSNSP